MSGRVIHEAPEPAGCYPLCSRPKPVQVVGREMTTVHYPGTVWECGCGRTWVLRDSPDGAGWEPEGRFRRWRRLRRHAP